LHYFDFMSLIFDFVVKSSFVALYFRFIRIMNNLRQVFNCHFAWYYYVVCVGVFWIYWQYKKSVFQNILGNTKHLIVIGKPCPGRRLCVCLIRSDIQPLVWRIGGRAMIIFNRIECLVQTVHQIQYRHIIMIIKKALYTGCITETRRHERCFSAMRVYHHLFLEQDWTISENEYQYQDS